MKYFKNIWKNKIIVEWTELDRRDNDKRYR